MARYHFDSQGRYIGRTSRWHTDWRTFWRLFIVLAAVALILTFWH